MARLAFLFRRLHFQVRKSPRHFPAFSTAATEPPPIRVGITTSSGRGVFATRRISAGELIHTAEPVVSHPSISRLHEVCYFCLRKLSKPNAGLEAHGTVSFCSEQCEKRSKGLKYPILVKRLASQVISGAVSQDVLDILQPEISSAEKLSLMKREFYLLKSTFEDTNIENELMSSTYLSG